jgi:hypothetical protein
VSAGLFLPSGIPRSCPKQVGYSGGDAFSDNAKLLLRTEENFLGGATAKDQDNQFQGLSPFSGAGKGATRDRFIQPVGNILKCIRLDLT